MSASIILPLKGTKPAELSNALLSYYADVTKTRPPEAAAAAARTLDQVRERLSSIKALSDTTADAAATELLAYERQLAALARRLDNAGAALNVRFIWRDAFRPKQKVEKGDLDWERVCTLFNAAAALGYAALHHTDVGKKTLSALDELKKMCVPSRSDPSHCRRCVLPLPCSLAAGYN